MTQRGYNIVEALIVLAVFGLVLGGALVPLQKRFQTEEIKATEELLHEAKAAVYTYALNHRTAAGRVVVYYNGFQYPIPAGRPYLPCPDINYDGEEDRVAPPADYLFTLSVSVGGNCEETKGLLPWKTLGLRGVDAWGNHFTYRVDERFSSELFGFDETASADAFDIYADLASGGFYATVTAQTRMAAVVCTNFYESGTTAATLVNCPDGELSNIVGGIITSVSLTLGARRIEPLDVGVSGTGLVQGMAFVVLSHGPDGAGAVGRGGNCHVPAAHTRDLGEIANSYYRPGHPFRAAPFNCIDPTSIVVPGVPVGTTPLREHLFVGRPMANIHNTDVDGPDDLLLWSGRNELLGYLVRNGVFPVDKLEYLPR